MEIVSAKYKIKESRLTKDPETDNRLGRCETQRRKAKNKKI